MDTYKVSLNVETCFHCLRKGIIKCEKCNLFYYCSVEHRSLEWKTYHFFECNIVQLIKEMKNYNGTSYTKKFLEKLREYVSKILQEIFYFIEDENDYQEYMIYIHFLLDLHEKFGINNFYKSIFKILALIPKDENDKFHLLITKTLLAEASILYLNLKMSLIKFAFEANYIRIADHYCNQMRELMAYIKRDQAGVHFLKK